MKRWAVYSLRLKAGPNSDLDIYLIIQTYIVIQTHLNEKRRKKKKNKVLPNLPKSPQISPPPLPQMNVISNYRLYIYICNVYITTNQHDYTHTESHKKPHMNP